MTVQYQFATDEHIFYYTGKAFKHMASITKNEFSWWLKKERKLEYPVDSVDDGQYRQTTFTMTFDDYLETMKEEDINSDLLEFLNDQKK